MSRNINVNPAHYKVAGRERQGEDIIQQQQKQAYATQQAGGMSDGVPPWEATRHSFVSAQPPEPAPARKARKPRAKPRMSQPKRGMSQAKRPTARKTSKKTTRAKKMTRASSASARRRTAASRSASRKRSVKRTTRRR